MCSYGLMSVIRVRLNYGASHHAQRKIGVAPVKVVGWSPQYIVNSGVDVTCDGNLTSS